MSVSGERGQTTVLLIGFTLIAFAVAGFAVDGTRAFLLRRTLQTAADAAALVGASELDRATYYASGGEDVGLQPDLAQRTARDWFARRGIPARIAVTADGGSVRVTLRADLDTTFLKLVGLRSVPVAVDAAARPIPSGP